MMDRSDIEYLTSLREDVIEEIAQHDRAIHEKLDELTGVVHDMHETLEAILDALDDGPEQPPETFAR